MNKRKIILLAAIGVLAVVFALQLVFSGGDSVKTFTLTDKPDTLIIEKSGSPALHLTKKDDEWTIGEKKYPADANEITSLVKMLESVKVLETVSTGDDDERYGLSPEMAVTVTATKDAKELRRISIGKAAATSQQSYIKLDKNKAVLLVNGNFKRVFDKSLDDLRDKKIFELKADELTSVEVSGQENYKLVKLAAWSVAAPAVSASLQLDKEKVEQWLAMLVYLKAEGFAPEGPLPAGNPLGKISFMFGDKTVLLTVHQKLDEKYLCSSSASPYLFYLPEYTVSRFAKPLKELAAGK